MKFKVTTCSGVKRFSTAKAAIKYARGASVYRVVGCPHVKVSRTRPLLGRREHETVLALCKNRACKVTPGWRNLE